uniref:Uncharacterized protein n=1 Tax=Clytia hemisphaerica TaxID=252671 RepID=A0A7M5X4U7_9CNID
MIGYEKNGIINESDYDDVISDEEAGERYSQSYRRTKSYPEELIRGGIKQINGSIPQMMKMLNSIPQIVIQPQTDDEESEVDSIHEDEEEEYIRLAALRSRNNSKRLKSCGQVQSALVVMAIKDNDSIQLWRLLSRKDVDVSEFDGAGMQPVHYACLFGNLEMLKIVIQNEGNINELTKSEDSCLDIAVREGNFEVAQYLVSKGAKIKSIVNGMMGEKRNKRTFDGAKKNRRKLSNSNEI